MKTILQNNLKPNIYFKAPKMAKLGHFAKKLL